METNEKAQNLLLLVHNLSGDLHAASTDGKIDTGEMLKALVNCGPDLLALVGVDLGNS